MSAISANSAVFARKAVAGKAVAAKRTATRARAAFNVSASAKVDACDKNSVIVSPSILSADFANLGAEVRANSPARGLATVSTLPRRTGKKAASLRRRERPMSSLLSSMPRAPGRWCGPIALGKKIKSWIVLPARPDTTLRDCLAVEVGQHRK